MGMLSRSVKIQFFRTKDSVASGDLKSLPEQLVEHQDTLTPIFFFIVPFGSLELTDKPSVSSVLISVRCRYDHLLQ